MNALVSVQEVVLCNCNSADYRQLKAAYVEGLARLVVLSKAISDLRELALSLRKRGVSRATLVRWGVEAGYAEAYIRTLVSKLLCEVGQRARVAGAGPQSPPEACSIFRSVCQEYGANRATQLLRAALHVAQKESATQAPAGSANSRNLVTLQVPTLS